MRTDDRRGKELVRQKGLEPLAYCLEGSCSIRLSYWRILERVTRIELASPAWKAGALAIVLHPRTGPFARSTAANRQLANNNMKLQICQYLFPVFAKFFQLKSGGGEGHPSRRHRTSPPPTVASTRTVSSSSGGRTAGSRSRTIRSARFPGARVPRSPSAWYCQAAPAVKA